MWSHAVAQHQQVTTMDNNNNNNYRSCEYTETCCVQYNDINHKVQDSHFNQWWYVVINEP